MMDLKSKIKKTLREYYGEFESNLEIEYEDTVTNKLINGSSTDKDRWATYNQLMIELKHNLKNNEKVKELQYKLTDDSNPTEVCIELISELSVKNDELERLYYKMKNF